MLEDFTIIIYLCGIYLGCGGIFGRFCCEKKWFYFLKSGINHVIFKSQTQFYQ